jgi:hypothetical protein
MTASVRRWTGPLTLTAVASVLTFGACSNEDPLGPGFEQSFAHLSGCADLVFFAVDSDDELMLSFVAEGLVAGARSAGAVTVTLFSLPDAGATLKLEQGSRISDAMCDDVIENNGPQVSRTWTATAGTATVTVRPDATQESARADLLLQDVVFERGEGERVTLERLEWSDVSVGWFPG